MIYEVLNLRTFNTLASFDTLDGASEARDRFVALDEYYAQELALVAYDDEGNAIDVMAMPPAYPGDYERPSE